VIRVLRVIARLNIGGPAIHVTLLTERLDPTRYESILVTGTEGPGEGNYLALHGRAIRNVVTVPALGREIGPRDLPALGALVRLIRRTRPHIVHTHTAKGGTLGRTAAALCRVPVIVHTFHGHVLQGYFSPARTRLFLGIERALARVSDCLVAVSSRVREELLALGIGTPSAFDVVPLGLDLEPFAGSAARRGELRRELGLSPEVPLVGIVARLVPVKAHEVFLEAAQVVAQAHSAAQFLIVGDGERRAELEQLAARAGLSARVRFLGWRGDLDRVYADLDVAVLTSKNEGSPVALIEAMAAGRAVVATQVGGVPDVVTDGVTGRLVPGGDAVAAAHGIIGLLQHPDQRAQLGGAARAFVLDRFGAARLLQDVDGLYRRLLAEKGQRSS
jgi:glycosyltransferase involved in cell wall biosynthesis